VTVAVVGFIGVIAGALITAWFNQRAEKDRRRATARVAAHLIATELEQGTIRLRSSAKAGEWWSVNLSTELWKKNAPALAAEIRRSLLEELARAYSLFEVWDQKRASAGAGELEEVTVQRLETNAAQIDSVAERLKTAVRRPVATRAARPLQAALALGAFLLVCGLLYAASVPRTELTDASIATSLEVELPEAVVGCSSNADQWLCEVSYPPGRGCRIVHPQSQSTSLLVENRPSLGDGSCGAGAEQRARSYEVVEGADGPVATPSQVEIEQVMHEAGIQLSPPKSSYFTRARKWFFQGD
jgi:hypothetical protein